MATQNNPQQATVPAKLHVKVFEVGTIVYENPAALAVTSTNDKGLFDILPSHSNFIALIKEKIIIHEGGGRKKTLLIDRGILKVSENGLEIFLGISPEKIEGAKNIFGI